MKSASLKKVLTVAVAVAVLCCVANTASAQYPGYPPYPNYPSNGGMIPLPNGGIISPDRLFDPLTNIPQPGTEQKIHQHLPGGRVLDGTAYIDPYGIPRFTGDLTGPNGSKSIIVRSPSSSSSSSSNSPGGNYQTYRAPSTGPYFGPRVLQSR